MILGSSNKQVAINNDTARVYVLLIKDAETNETTIHPRLTEDAARDSFNQNKNLMITNLIPGSVKLYTLDVALTDHAVQWTVFNLLCDPLEIIKTRGSLIETIEIVEAPAA